MVEAGVPDRAAKKHSWPQRLLELQMTEMDHGVLPDHVPGLISIFVFIYFLYAQVDQYFGLLETKPFYNVAYLLCLLHWLLKMDSYRFIAGISFISLR